MMPQNPLPPEFAKIKIGQYRLLAFQYPKTDVTRGLQITLHIEYNLAPDKKELGMAVWAQFDDELIRFYLFAAIITQEEPFTDKSALGKIISYLATNQEFETRLTALADATIEEQQNNGGTNHVQS